MKKLVRPIRVEGDLAFIPLSQGLEAVIDAADVGLVSAHTWSAAKPQGVTYAITAVRSDVGKWSTIRLHHLILGVPNGLVIDHIDLDGLNNRRSNLRACTTAQNCRNHGMRRNNTSGFKGVSWRRDRQRWQVHIRVDRRRLSLGHYDSFEEASNAYAEASQKFHGEFGRLT